MSSSTSMAPVARISLAIASLAARGSCALSMNNSRFVTVLAKCSPESSPEFPAGAATATAPRLGRNACDDASSAAAASRIHFAKWCRHCGTEPRLGRDTGGNSWHAAAGFFSQYPLLFLQFSEAKSDSKGARGAPARAPLVDN